MRLTHGACLGLAVVLVACGGGDDKGSEGSGSAPERFAVTATVDIGEEGVDVVVGDDAVWVSDRRQTVVRIDPKSNAVVARIAVAAGAGNLAVGEGALWTSGRTAVTRIDVAANRVNGSVEVGRPQDVAAGRGGVWVANLDGNGTLNRIEPETLRVAATVKVPGLPGDTLVVPQEPAQVEVGEGGVWVSDPRAGAVHRLDPGSNKFTKTIIRMGVGGRGMAVGEGSVWVVGESGVSRADPGADRPEQLDIVNDAAPQAVAVGLDAVWITETEHETVARVDPSTNQVTTSVQLEEAPVAVAVGFDAVWVVGRYGLVSRVERQAVPASRR